MGLLSISQLTTWLMPQLISTICFLASKTMTSPSSVDQPQRWLCRYPCQVLTKGGTKDQTWCLCKSYTHQCWEKTWLLTCCLGWLTPGFPCRQDHLWMPWWNKRCSKSSLPISCPLWCTDHLGWNHSQKRSPPHPSCWEEGGYYVLYVKNTKASPIVSPEHDNVSTTLGSTLTSNEWLSHAPHINYSTLRSQGSHSSWLQHKSTRGNI